MVFSDPSSQRRENGIFSRLKCTLVERWSLACVWRPTNCLLKYSHKQVAGLTSLIAPA